MKGIDEHLKRLKEDSLTTFFQADTLFTRNAYPVIDTKSSSKKDVAKIIYMAYRNYLLNDNMRLFLQLYRSPINVSGYQPTLGKSVAETSTYGLGLNFQFRLHKGLFFQLDDHENYDIGGIKNNEDAYSLAYALVLNQKGHPVTIFPLLGYSHVSLMDKKQEYYSQKSFTWGLDLAYDLNYRWSLFMTERYYSLISRINDRGLNINLQNIAISCGLLFKLKL